MSAYSVQDRVVNYLRKYGPLDTATIGQALGLTADSVSRTLRALHWYKRWGVHRVGIRVINSRNVGVWAVDEKEYLAFLAYVEKPRGRTKGAKDKKPRAYHRYRRELPEEPAPEAVPPKQKAAPVERKIRIPASPYKTVWLPCSPYHSIER